MARCVEYAAWLDRHHGEEEVLTGSDHDSASKMLVGILIEARPGEFGADHDVMLELVDKDGQPVPVPDGDDPLLRIEGQIQLLPPPDPSPAMPVVIPLAFNAANVPLPAGQWLEFRLWMDGETQENWRLPFATRAEEPTAT